MYTLPHTCRHTLLLVHGQCWSGLAVKVEKSRPRVGKSISWYLVMWPGLEASWPGTCTPCPFAHGGCRLLALAFLLSLNDSLLAAVSRGLAWHPVRVSWAPGNSLWGGYTQARYDWSQGSHPPHLTELPVTCGHAIWGPSHRQPWAPEATLAVGTALPVGLLLGACCLSVELTGRCTILGSSWG